MHSATGISTVRQAGVCPAGKHFMGHLYNLGNSARFRKRAAVWDQRDQRRYRSRAEEATTEGRPGFLRVDTVHQGDWDGAQGAYHNAVDTVNAVGSRSAAQQDQRAVPDASAGSDLASISLRDSLDSTPTMVPNTSITPWRRLLEKLLIEFTKTCLPHPGQCFSGGQERGPSSEKASVTDPFLGSMPNGWSGPRS